MKLLALAAAAVVVATVTPVVHADEENKKTIITVNEAIQIPGRVLPPGKYVLRLMDSRSNRHIVQVFNEDQNDLKATIYAIRNQRPQRADKTVLEYWEMPAGSPPALKAWYYPGEFYGNEFSYPKGMADQISKNNHNAKVSVDDQTIISEVDNRNASAAPVATLAQVSEPAPVRARTVSAAVSTPAPTQQNNTVLAAPERAPEVLLAQNQVPAGQTPIPSNNAPQLPATASPLGWISLLGISCLVSAMAIRLLRRA